VPSQLLIIFLVIQFTTLNSGYFQTVFAKLSHINQHYQVLPHWSFVNSMTSVGNVLLKLRTAEIQPMKK